MAKFKIGKVVGPIGPQGEQGPSGTMRVGAVHTLQPGEAATVKNTGTTENAVLDFSIPRGDDGITDLVAEYRADWSHTCTPTVAAPVVIKEIAGKTEQVQTTGAQLLDADYFSRVMDVGVTNPNFNKVVLDGNSKFVTLHGVVHEAGTYILSHSEGYHFAANRLFVNGNAVVVAANKLPFVFQVTTPGEVAISLERDASGTDSTDIPIGSGSIPSDFKFILNAGSTALPWEPYTGGKPGPNPDYPQDIKGAGDSGSLMVESQGTNLIDFDEWASKSPAVHGTVIFDRSNGSVTLVANADDCYTEWTAQFYTVQVKPNTAYTLSWDYSGALGIVFLFRNGLSNSCVYTENNAKKIKIVTESTTAFLTFRVGARTANTTCKYWNIQLQEGDTVTPYQPYHHTTATIPLSSPLYSGDKICCVHPGESYVDVDGKAVVAHRVLWGVRRERVSVMFDGSADENWVYANSSRQFHILPTPEPIGTESTKENAYSSFFRNGNISERNEGNSNNIIYTGDATPRNFLGIQSDKWTTLADFKAYLQSCPVDVVYKLATPYFEPFPDQSPFHTLRTADDLTYIYTDDALKPEITVDVAKQAAGGYLLDGYINGIVGRSTAEDTASLETTIENYYAMRRTGKVYQTKIYKYASNPTSTGEKLMDNAGLVCQPSTDTTEGQDDYADIPLFQWYNVNYVRDRYGNPHPTAIEGQPAYKTSGSVDVGVMQMSFYINIDTSNVAYDLWTISDMPHPELGLVPYPGAVRADGTMAPYVIHSKYVSGYAADGLLRSQPNTKPEKWQSYNNMIVNYQKKGEGYWGAGTERNFFQMVFQIIKYTTKSSQTVMYGCATYNFQYSASVQWSDKRTYFPVTNAQAANFIVGAYVSVGYGSNNNGTVNIDRGVGTMHSYADIVKVLRIEDLDANNKAVYLDVAQGFATTPIALTSTLNAPITISSMHWWSGTTDRVKGHHDGSIVSNTNGKYPYRMQGLEYAVGGYIVASDTVMDFKSDYSKDVYIAKKGQPHSSADATIRSTYKKVGNIPAYTNGGDWWIGDIAVDLETGCWYPSVVGASDTQGMGDRCYAGGAYTSGTREYLQGGDLGNGSVAGAASLHCGHWLGNAGWNCLSCD